jgi:hypothetical protein
MLYLQSTKPFGNFFDGVNNLLYSTPDKFHQTKQQVFPKGSIVFQNKTLSLSAN